MHGTVFGRITPQQKERLVDALQSRGHYVAMTGDGVNDVLSLKKAISASRWRAAARPTRGVADIVLLNDSFSAVPRAFREGQRIRHGLTGILDLFLTRVFTVALIIICVLAVQAGFPFSPGHMSLLTTSDRRHPDLRARALGQAGARAEESLSLVAALRVPRDRAADHRRVRGLRALFLSARSALRAVRRTQGLLARLLPRARSRSRRTASPSCCFERVWLIVFASPPTKFWAVCEECTGDWRPTILAMAMVPSTSW